MATTHEGIFGGFTGTIGAVTGYMRNGQNILRSSTSNVRYRRTALRSVQLEKIKLCNSFTKAFTGTGFFNKTFPAYGHTGNGYNRATSALMNQAITTSGGSVQLAYPKVLVCKGMLPGAEGAAAVLLPGGNLQFTFTDNSHTGTAGNGDAIVLVAYCPALKQAVFTLNAGHRKDGTAILNAAAFKGYTVETWIGFLSNDTLNASDSFYTGAFGV
jgi:uncharacterized protein DUF6266